MQDVYYQQQPTQYPFQAQQYGHPPSSAAPYGTPMPAPYNSAPAAQPPPYAAPAPRGSRFGRALRRLFVFNRASLAPLYLFAWSDTAAATTAYAYLRLAFGAALIGFTAWSWAQFSSAQDYGDGYGSYGRTMSQITNWGLLFTALYFTLVGGGYLAMLWGTPSPVLRDSHGNGYRYRRGPLATGTLACCSCGRVGRMSRRQMEEALAASGKGKGAWGTGGTAAHGISEQQLATGSSASTSGAVGGGGNIGDGGLGGVPQYLLAEAQPVGDLFNPAPARLRQLGGASSSSAAAVSGVQLAQGPYISPAPALGSSVPPAPAAYPYPQSSGQQQQLAGQAGTGELAPPYSYPYPTAATAPQAAAVATATTGGGATGGWRSHFGTAAGRRRVAAAVSQVADVSAASPLSQSSYAQAVAGRSGPQAGGIGAFPSQQGATAPTAPELPPSAAYPFTTTTTTTASAPSPSPSTGLKGMASELVCATSGAPCAWATPVTMAVTGPVFARRELLQAISGQGMRPPTAASTFTAAAGTQVPYASTATSGYPVQSVPPPIFGQQQQQQQGLQYYGAGAGAWPSVPSKRVPFFTWPRFDYPLRFFIAYLWSLLLPFQLLITVLFWSGGADSTGQGPRTGAALGSSIVKHILLSVVLLDALLNRARVGAEKFIYPLLTAVVYLGVTGIYTGAMNGRGPYEKLDWSSGWTAGLIGIGFALMLAGWLLLWVLQNVRDRWAERYRAKRACKRLDAVAVSAGR